MRFDRPVARARASWFGHEVHPAHGRADALLGGVGDARAVAQRERHGHRRQAELFADIPERDFAFHGVCADARYLITPAARPRFLLSSRRTAPERCRMPTYRLPYGHGFLECDLTAAAAAGHRIEVVEPAAVAPARDAAAEVEAALEAAVLPEYRGGGCAIAINDRTRPVPHDVLLPPLLAPARARRRPARRRAVHHRHRDARPDADGAVWRHRAGRHPRTLPGRLARRARRAGPGAARRDLAGHARLDQPRVPRARAPRRRGRHRAAPVRRVLRRREERRHRPGRLRDHRAQPLDDVAPARAARPLRRQPLPAGHRGDRRPDRGAPRAERHPR